MKLNPYLVMPGTTKEAMMFYEKVLDGKIVTISEFGDMPGIPEEARQFVIHGLLEFNGNVLMFSDSLPGQTLTIGDNITLSLHIETVEKSKELYEALKEGGEVILELQETFWSKSYGQVKDRFGILWQINVA